jgi:hypothetical protein
MAAIFTAGDIVQLVGIRSHQSLNGAIGTLIGDIDGTQGRYDVKQKSPAVAGDTHPVDESHQIDEM